jgi:hypothetical protein
MRKRTVTRSLRGRVQQLESVLSPAEEPANRMGYIIRELPPEYSGERHLAVVRVCGCDNWNRQWCEVEERPGPAPRRPAEPVPAACFTDLEMGTVFGPAFEWTAFLHDFLRTAGRDRRTDVLEDRPLQCLQMSADVRFRVSSPAPVP